MKINKKIRQLLVGGFFYKLIIFDVIAQRLVLLHNWVHE